MHAPRAYFSYGLPLDPQFREGALELGVDLQRGALARALDVDLRCDQAAPQWEGRIARLVTAHGRSVEGRLFMLTEAELARVGALEAAAGATTQRQVVVEIGNEHMRAVAYTSTEASTFDGPVSVRYADALARSARAGALPEDYVLRLEAEALILARVQAFGATRA